MYHLVEQDDYIVARSYQVEGEYSKMAVCEKTDLEKSGAFRQ
jgi:hypothetical protein